MKRLFILLTFVMFYAAVNRPVAAITLQPQTLMVNGNTVQLQVPVGMQVKFVAPLPDPRFLTRGPDNELLIGSSGSNIYRLRWPYANPETLASLPGRYHSIAYRNGSIYVAETGGLYAAAYISSTAPIPPGSFALVTPLPSLTGGHWSRTVIVGPDQRLYISLGISSNCADDEYLNDLYDFEFRRGGVFVLDESGAAPVLVPYSSGLRNPIGIAFHPSTGILYATNAGSDNLGFDLPPEVLAPLSLGSFHGMPWFQYYNGAFRSGECATTTPPRPVAEATPPAITFAARSTPEGLVFVDSPDAAPLFQDNALVAIHGSWAVPPGGDSSTRRPPKIVMVGFAAGTPVNTTDIVTGFQRPDGSRFARPCGMILGPDGNLYFTSDGGEVTGLFRLAPVPGTTRATTSTIIPLLLRKKGQV